MVDFKLVFIDFWTYKIDLWLITFIIILSVIIKKIVLHYKIFRNSKREKELELDKQLFLRIRDWLLPQDGSIGFLRKFNFSCYCFNVDAIADIYKFENENENSNSNFHFHHPYLERIKNELAENVKNFTSIVSTETFSTDQSLQAIPMEWELEQPERFKWVVKDIHTYANSICSKYDELITAADTILNRKWKGITKLAKLSRIYHRFTYN